MKKLNERINRDMTEENFRIKHLVADEKINEVEEIQKFEMIGKIGHSKTLMMIRDDFPVKSYRIDNNKSSRMLLKANNCVFKGKWVFEVLLLTNMEIIIGWVIQFF